jgi:hypothetical protein
MGYERYARDEKDAQSQNIFREMSGYPMSDRPQQEQRNRESGPL